MIKIESFNSSLISIYKLISALDNSQAQ